MGAAKEALRVSAMPNKLRDGAYTGTACLPALIELIQQNIIYNHTLKKSMLLK